MVHAPSRVMVRVDASNTSNKTPMIPPGMPALGKLNRPESELNKSGTGTIKWPVHKTPTLLPQAHGTNNNSFSTAGSLTKNLDENSANDSVENSFTETSGSYEEAANRLFSQSPIGQMAQEYWRKENEEQKRVSRRQGNIETRN